MPPSEQALSNATLEISNVGGIDTTQVDLSPGVNILEGRNATNRTSFLQGLMAALGSERVSLKADAEKGYAELTLNDKRYTRHLRRRGGDIAFEGDSYLTDSEVADLFAFLLEDNEARRAVELDADLRELILRPVDTASIEAEIQQLKAERKSVETSLEEMEEKKRRLTELEQKRQDLMERLESKRAELNTTREELEADRDSNADESTDAELQETLDKLSEVRDELDEVEFDLETQRKSVEDLETEREELKATLEGLDPVSEDEIERLSERVDEHRRRVEKLESEINDLQTIVEFNEKMLEGTSADIARTLRGDSESSVTDQLLDSDNEVVCWTCGSHVNQDEIEATLDSLRNLRREKHQTRKNVRSKIDELESEKVRVENRRDERESTRRKLSDIDDEIQRREARIEELTDRREELDERCEQLEEEVDELETKRDDERVTRQRNVAEIEMTVRRLENELEDVRTELEVLESDVSDRDELVDRRDEIEDELKDLRTRIQRIESEAVEEFNSHMESVLDVLEYDNIERVWIERLEREVRKGRKKETERTFDLHIVRSMDSGTVYEDTVAHLSESEREVVGLVFALAGFLAHDVYETCPFMVLDSLEAIDSERIAALVDYLQGFCQYLVVALLPEDAQALDSSYPRITTI